MRSKVAAMAMGLMTYSSFLLTFGGLRAGSTSPGVWSLPATMTRFGSVSSCTVCVAGGGFGTLYCFSFSCIPPSPEGGRDCRPFLPLLPLWRVDCEAEFDGTIVRSVPVLPVGSMRSIAGLPVRLGKADADGVWNGGVSDTG